MKKILSLVLTLILSLSLVASVGAEGKIFEGHSLVYTGWGDISEQAATQAVIDKFKEDTVFVLPTIMIPKLLL